MDIQNVHWKDNGLIKVLIIVGTRPEIIRLSEVINKCRLFFDTLLVHTGQNYDYHLNEVFFDELGVEPPDINLNVVGQNLGETIGNIIEKSYSLMEKIKPDAVLVLGDTNSCLSVIGAKRLHIPIFHMEAGNRCKDERLPEETNRRIVDIISDVNLPYSEQARRYLMSCGCAPERTFVTGSPMAEVLTKHLEKIISSNVIEKISAESGKEILKKGYFLLSAHREENIDDDNNFFCLFSSLNDIAETYKMPILYSCHPRSRKRLKQSGFALNEFIIPHEPLGFIDYNCLQINSFCVLSDSGTLPEESSFYSSIGRPFPAVSIRTSTERPEAMEKGKFIISGIDSKGLKQAIKLATGAINENSRMTVVEDYMDLDVSTKVINIIQSYTGIVNSYVWRKEPQRD